MAGGDGTPRQVVPGSVGILGGTFDPIHVGHLAIAEDARERLGLERVDFVPAGMPQLRPKPPAASAQDRAAMVELAISGNPAFRINRLEVTRDGATFTVDTLEILHARTREAGHEPDLWFILSAESLLTLPRWKSPERVLQLARLAVVPRQGTVTPDRARLESQFPGAGGRVAFLDGPLLAVSGSAIRRRLAAGRSIRYLVPDAVWAYIADHHLYRP